MHRRGYQLYKGAYYQKRYGQGGTFRRLFSWIIPIVQKHAFPANKEGLREVGKTAINTAADIAKDSIQGRDSIQGITLNSLACLKINFDKIKNIICSPDRKITSVKVPQFKFVRDRDHWVVKTIVQEKQYRMVYDKRILLDDLSTLPYGY